MRILSLVQADVFPNPAYEPIFVAHAGVPPGALSKAVIESGFPLLGEACLSATQIEQVINLHPLPC